MRWWVLAVVVLSTLVAVGMDAPRAAVVAQSKTDCMDDPLGPLPGYSAITHGDFNQSNTESDGRLVVGGNATLSSFGVATKLVRDPSRIDLATGGNLTLDSVGINNGSVTYGGTITPAGFTVPNGTVTKAAPPFNVDALFDGLLIRSTSWAELDSLPVDDPAYVSFDGYNLTLTGPSKVRNVFTFDAADLARAGALRLKVPDGATTLINVIGGHFQNPFAGGVFIWDEATGFVQPGNPARNADLEARRRALLWNFPNAASVTLGPPYAAWEGSVLAPRASVALTYQHIFGSIAAASVSGTGEIGYNPPNPCLPNPTPCPEPSPTPTATPTQTPTATPTSTPTPIPTVSPSPTPVPTPTPTPTPTPVPTPTPTPLPTVSPEPIVTPTPTPDISDPGEPLEPGEGPGEVVVAGGSAEVDVCKKVITPKGRAVEKRRVHAGQVVKFRIRVTNLGTDLARNVRVCDIVPEGLTFVRATVKVSFRNGRPCVTVPLLSGQRQAFVWMRVARTARGSITNIAAVTSRDGGTRKNPATVVVIPVPGGGVTG